MSTHHSIYPTSDTVISIHYSVLYICLRYDCWHTFIFIFSTSWHKQPYSRGSYTAVAVGASQIDIEQIAQPLYTNRQKKVFNFDVSFKWFIVMVLFIDVAIVFQPTMLFAGEHTHSNFYSTVHGAYLSGRTAAQQLLLPEEGQEVVLECNETSDLSSWIQGMSMQWTRVRVVSKELRITDIATIFVLFVCRSERNGFAVENGNKNKTIYILNVLEKRNNLNRRSTYILEHSHFFAFRVDLNVEFHPFPLFYLMW